jgi:hypothetical protein
MTPIRSLAFFTMQTPAAVAATGLSPSRRPRQGLRDFDTTNKEWGRMSTSAAILTADWSVHWAPRVDVMGQVIDAAAVGDVHFSVGRCSRV